jgi:hypothetical protein
MSNAEKQSVARHRTGTRYIVTLCVVAAAVAGAVFVVLKNARKVSTGPVPEALQPVRADTGFAAFRAGLWRKVKVLDRRCKGKEQLLQGKLTPVEDSLLSLSRAGIKSLFVGLARLDSVPGPGRKVAQDSLRAEYELVKSNVNAFARSGKVGPDISDDSLDAEVRRLVGK